MKRVPNAHPSGVLRVCMQAFVKDCGLQDCAAKIGIALTAGAGEGQDSSGAPVVAGPASVADMRDKGFIASSRGFKQDVYFTYDARPDQVFCIKAVSEDKMVAQRILHANEVEQIEIGIDELLTKCKVHKGKVQSRLEFQKCDLPSESSEWLQDAVKHAASLLVRSKSLEAQGVIDNLEILKDPVAVRVRKAFAKGDLVIRWASPQASSSLRSQSWRAKKIIETCFRHAM